MKNGIKRFVAILLLVALLASFAIPATFADTQTVQSASTVYDFDLTSSTDVQINGYNWGGVKLKNKPTRADGAVNDKSCIDLLQQFYADDTCSLNWKVEAYIASAKTNESAFVADKGLNTYISSGSNSGYLALRLAAPSGGAGVYTVSMEAFKTKSAVDPVDVYLVNAAAYTDAEAVIAAGTGKIFAELDTVGSHTASESVTLDGGELILVIDHTDYVKGFFGINNLTLSLVADTPETTTQESTEVTTQTTTQKTTEVTTETTTQATESSQPEETVVPSTPGIMDYDFDLAASTDAKISNYYWGEQIRKAVKLADGKTVDSTYKNYMELLKALYNNSTCSLNWNVESHYNDTFRSSFSAGSGMTTLIGTLDTYGYIAYRLAAPTGGAGEYKAILEVTGDTLNTVDVYLVEASRFTDVNSSMTDDNQIFGDLNAAGTYKTEEALSLDGGEMILILKHTARSTKNRFGIKSFRLISPELDQEEEEPVVPPVPGGGAVKDGFFDMELYNYKAFSGLGKGYKNYDKTYNSDYTVRQYLEASYPENVNWKLEGYSAGTADGNILFVGSNGSEQGLRANDTDWMALRLNVTLTGTYDVTFTKATAGFTGQVWIFPATAETLTTEQIEGAMTNENLLGDIRLSGENKSYVAGAYTFTAGEYIVVLDGTGNRMYLGSIAIAEHYVEPPKQPVDKVKYDFHLVGIDPAFPQKGIVNWADAEKTERVYTRISRMYADDVIQWKYEGVNGDTPNAVIRETYMRFKAVPDYIEYENAWTAFRIEAPGAGTYDVRLNCVGANTMVMNVYLIPAVTGVSMTTEEIKAGMTADNLLVSKARIKGNGEFYLGEYNFGTEYEYVLVFNFVRGSRLNLVNMEVTKDGLKADGQLPVGRYTPGVVYDLDLGDEFEGVLTPYGESRYDFPDVFTQVQSRWDRGVQNWKWEYASDSLLGNTQQTSHAPNTNTRFYKTTGMRVYGSKDSWVALRIKSPGEGTFTVSTNHATSANDGTLAMYVLPGDTAKEDIWAATDPTNRVGKVVLTNETGESAIKDGSTSFVGYFNFEAGKEYILVLECYENSIFANTLCYMNISQIFMQKGMIAQDDKETTKTVTPITVADKVIKVADAGLQSAVTEVNGCDYYFVNLEGGTLLVYNLDTAELLDQAEIGIKYGRSMAVAPDGKVWMAGDAKYLVCYDPVTLTWEKTATMPGVLGYNFTYTNALTVDENGMIYVSLSSTNVIKYDPENKEFTDLGKFVEGSTYVGALTYHKGYLYAHYYAPDVYSYVVKYELATRQVVAKTDVFAETKEKSVIIRPISIIDDSFMLCGSNDQTEGALAIDIHTMEKIEVDLPGAINLGCSEEIDGKYYIVLHGYGLYEYDVQTKAFSKAVGFGNGGTGFRSAGSTSYGSTLVTIDGERCLFTYTASGAHPRFYNLDTREYITWNHMVYGVGGGSNLNTICVGPEGSREIYVAGWNTDYGAIYNIDQGGVRLQYETAGQSDSMRWYEGKFYVANYSSTTLNETYPDTQEVIQRFKLDHELTGQLRPIAMEVGGGYVFVGTVPGSNLNGGAVTCYNTKTGEYHCQRNVVPDQSIISLAYNDGIIFCGSTRSGGQGSELKGEAAMIVAYDYENEEVLAILDLRDHIRGLANPVNYIYGLTADPNAEENGRIWGVVSDTLFCFTFDKETRTFRVQEVLSYNKQDHRTNNAASWKGEPLSFDAEQGTIYVCFRNTGGFRAVKLTDWNAPVGEVKVESAQRLMGYYTLNYVLAEDGNIYFSNGGDLMMLPLNVSQEDWAIAGEVDAMFRAIHEKDVTLETEADIRTARSAYENLTWYYKALVQDLELLQESESDILECKITASLTGLEVTADAYPMLQELMDEYEGLNSRQQRYVKNYEDLKETYDTASKLNDERIAAAMQKKVNALKDLFPITLEEEPDVIAVRTEYDALTGSQKLMVDINILKEAEAQVVVLRAEFVKYVNSLIQALPEEITLAAEPAITEARNAFEKLYAQERKQVSFAKLDQAEFKLRSLQNAKAVAENVDMLIQEIGIVTLGDKARIAEARKAYNALDEVGRTFCTKANKLKRAEFILKALQTWGIPVIVIADAGILFAVAWFVPSLHQKVFKSKKKESIEN